MIRNRKRRKEIKKTHGKKRTMGNIGNSTKAKQQKGETLVGYMTIQFRVVGAQTCILGVLS